jgi:hypothetical protein
LLVLLSVPRFGPTTILIGPFQNTAWNTVVTPHRVPRLIAQRAVPRFVHPDALERSRAWFRSCLFMCTLLELFVYQSSYLSTLAGAVWKSEDCYGISLPLDVRTTCMVTIDHF